jgi:hypothetical protein
MTSCATFGERLRAEWVLTIDLCAGREGIGMRFGRDASPCTDRGHGLLVAGDMGNTLGGCPG